MILKIWDRFVNVDRALVSTDSVGHRSGLSLVVVGVLDECDPFRKCSRTAVTTCW